MGISDKNRRINMALGKIKCDLVIKNTNVINVFTKEIIKGDIGICNDLIIGIGNYTGVTEIDGSNKYVCPSLIDAHMHIESTMANPSELCKVLLPQGTTTVITDPHEITNVCGINGLNYMLNATKDLPMNVYFMMPSCVPATQFENNGATLNAELMELYINNDRVLGLAEVMDYPSLLNCNETLLKKLDLFDSRIIDGHAPNLSGKELNAYRSAGVMTDHECSTIDEALERLRLGMYVQIREGSAAKNLENIIKGMLDLKLDFNNCLFCTDDKHIEDIQKNGHISENIRKAISLGVNPIDAICMATINAARCYKLKRLGAVAPSYSADLIILNDLQSFDIDTILYRGKVVSNDEIRVSIAESPLDPNVLNTVRIPHVTEDSLCINIKNELATVIELKDNELLTKATKCKVKTDNNIFIADETYSKLAVIERHKATGNIGLGIISNFNIKNGATASTVGHDSHNLIVAGDNDDDMLLAIDTLNKCNGGYTIVSNGKVIATLELPIAGLISTENYSVIDTKLHQMIKIAKDLGVNKNIDPFITLSFLSLPVIPELRVTDLGLFDVVNFKLTEI